MLEYDRLVFSCGTENESCVVCIAAAVPNAIRAGRATHGKCCVERVSR